MMYNTVLQQKHPCWAEWRDMSALLEINRPGVAGAVLQTPPS